MELKKSFIIHKDSLTILDKLSNEDAGKLFKAIKSIQEGTETEHELLIQIALEPFIQQFKRDNDKWEGIKERNSINGSKGGRPSKSVSNAETQQNPKNPVGYLETQQNPTEPKKAVSVSVSVSDSGSVIGSESEKKKRFVKPTTSEVEIYYSSFLESINRKLTPQEIKSKSSTFVDYYESNGWRVGKNPMKDWKATIRTWINKDHESKATHQPSHEVQMNYDRKPKYT